MRFVRRPVSPRSLRSGWGRYAQEHPERAAFYASPEWRGARRRHLQLEPKCRACGATADHVDHILSRAEGGAGLDPSNLQSMCAEHHHAKTVQESHRGMKRAAKQRKNPQV